MCSGRVWLKYENLQRTGAYKLRGALNRLLTLPEDARARGVIAASAGNHAQGVAVAAQMAGVPCWIVMPRQAPLASTWSLTLEVRDRAHGRAVVAALQQAGYPVALVK